MKVLKKWICAGAILMAVGTGGMTAQAADAGSINQADYKKALETAPMGIVMDGEDAAVTTEKTDSQNRSKAEIVSGNNPSVPNGQVVSMTRHQSEYASIWSKHGSEFELTKPQTTSMWLYFGNQYSASGEGMAFAIHNDARGVNAMPELNKKGSVPGETLGVWPSDTVRTQGEAAGLAKRGIQNSWALEFDTHQNIKSGGRAAGQADSFDLEFENSKVGDHIASNHPGSSASFIQHVDSGVLWTGNTPINVMHYYYHIQHVGMIGDKSNSNYLSNGQWRHLTLKWQPANHEGNSYGQMTYVFDDKDPRTGERLNGREQTVNVNVNTIDPDRNGKARWGLAGTTTTKFASNQLVVFEKAPDLIDGKTTTTLKNLTRKKEVKAGGEVFAKDKLELSYQFNYQDGQQANWANIQSYLKLPTDIDYDKAEVTYSNGQVQNISFDDRQDQSINVFLAEKLNKDVATASIRFTGRAAAVDDRREVASTTSKYTSNVMIGELTTPDFVINPSQELTLTVTSDQHLSLPVNESTTITGQVDLDSAATLAHDEPIWVHVTINGKVQKEPVKVAEDGTFKVTLQANQLQKGDNVIEVVATSGELRSNAEEVTISCSGCLELTAPSDVSFESKQLTGQRQELKRGDGWELSVQDTRGAGSKWRLSVKAATFVNEAGDHLLGKPVYATREGKTPIEKEMTPIVTHETTKKQAKNHNVYGVTDDWDHQTGMFLSIDDGATAGNYQGELTWSLDDVPS
ncbi:WxL domain-containing protein [Levilactobacillus brevis]|uniref:WxL domain-containing protein n=1 Tax=Levilactobacillus brevis TaxID=1580 RepID=UPI0035166298